MSDFEIRPATEADLPTLLVLIRELAEYEKLSDKLAVTESSLLRWLFGERRVAEAVLGCRRGEAVAYAAFYPTFSTFSGEAGLYLEDLFVQQDFRGSGYGRAMLRQVARIASERGFRSITWSVLDWNEPAMGFYRNLGAEPAPPDWLVYRLSGNALANLAREA